MREIERRISTIKNLIQGSRVGNNSRITSIIDDLDEVVHVSTINPERRKRLFKILYMSRGFDSFLSEYSGVRNTSLGNYLVTISQQGRRTSTGTVLDGHITASIHCGNGLYRKLSVTLLQACLVVLVKLCSIFVELTQVQRLRSGHKTCREDNASFAPYTQSRDLLVVVRLGDMTLKLKRCYRTFEFQSHVGYS
jgi:hypothetical protein